MGRMDASFGLGYETLEIYSNYTCSKRTNILYINSDLKTLQNLQNIMTKITQDPFWNANHAKHIANLERALEERNAQCDHMREKLQQLRIDRDKWKEGCLHNA